VKARPRELTFSEALACVYCGLSFEELAPRLFSFNSPYGACPDCTGLGVKIEIDPWKVIPDRSSRSRTARSCPWSKALGGGRYPSMNPYYMQQVEKLLRSRRVKLSTPIDKMPPGLAADAALRRRQQAEVHLRIAQPDTVELRDAVRGRRQQPAAPPQRDLVRVRQGRDREVHVGDDLQDL
jgi:excinuclease UvrABC ATPase subunit